MDCCIRDFKRIGVVEYHLKLLEIFKFHNFFNVFLLKPHKAIPSFGILPHEMARVMDLSKNLGSVKLI